MKTRIYLVLASTIWLSSLCNTIQLLANAQSIVPTNATNLPVGTCTKDIPCANGACCNGNTGLCGYNPSSDCAVGICTSNCNAKAECGQFADPPNKECPLSVCCSRFGFCGTTDEFCDNGCQSNCGSPHTPSCGSDQETATHKRIGYYEGWAIGRGCMAYPPERVAADSLTHINYAFALISPSFEIIEMTAGDRDLWGRTTALKKGRPALKVFLSIGGWTFNDPPSEKIFSNMVASEANTNTFIASVLSVMETYAFDGIDVDWEYPGADDRGGVPADTKNYVTFMSRVKDAFASRKYGLSFTAPSSYWYLQHFDLPGMMEHADWVNIMTYDLHGTWDGVDPYIGYVVGSHTNLTEIDAAFQLYWRVGVDPSKMVMGFGFYGRSFTLADPSCVTAGCAWTSGGKKGPCSDNSGTLMYSEIYSILTDLSQLPNIDEEAATAYITWDDNQWVSFDNDDTFKMKMNYANDHCIGGSMIWSVDQDNNNYDALEALYPDSVALGTRNTDSSDSTCYVTGCGTKTCSPDEIVSLIYKSPIDGACEIDLRIPFANPALVCCPKLPKNCTKRGYKDEKSLCVPQCEPGEVLIAKDVVGESFLEVCFGGETALCCETDVPVPADCTFSSDCSDTPDTSCPVNFPEFITSLSIARGVCADGKSFGFCCEKPLPYTECKWVGTPPGCVDAVCGIGQITVLSDPLGDGIQPCLGGAQRTYCCDPPVDLPVPFDDIFPDGTPEGSETFHVDFDGDVGVDNFKTGSGTKSTFGISEDEDDTAFGEVFIDSPKAGSVSSMNLKSNWVLTQCNPKSDQPQQVLAYCKKPNDHGCQHVHIDGAENTIIELPTSCGLGPYARVASLVTHPNQNALTGFHSQQKPASESLYLLSFDYNFAAIPESNGPIYMRADVTDMPGYWDNVVDSPPERKRWLKERGLEERWWGAFTKWLSKLNTVASDQSQSRTFFWQDTWTIFHEEAHCEGPPQFDASFDISLTGTAQMNARYGFYLQGTVIPPAVDAAYLYFSSDAEASATITLKGEASVTYNSDRVTFARFGFPGLYYPGLLTVGPSLVLEGYISGELSASGQMTTGLTYKFPSISYALGKTGDDDIGPNAQPSDPSNGFDYSFGLNVELSGDISVHAVPTIELGISVLGGSLIDANAFIRADLHVGVGITGSVSDTVSPNVCITPHYGASLEGGVTGSLLYWEASPMTLVFFDKDYPFGGGCFDSTTEPHGNGRRSLDPYPISASAGILPSYNSTSSSQNCARLIQVQGEHKHVIESQIFDVIDNKAAIHDMNTTLGRRSGSVPATPGIFGCPSINDQIDQDNTDNDIYSDISTSGDDDSVYRRSLSDFDIFDPDFEFDFDFHSDTFSETESLVHARGDNTSDFDFDIHPIVDVVVTGCRSIKFDPYPYKNAGNNYYNLASPTTLDTVFSAYNIPVGYVSSNTYGREHVYEMQLLADFIGQLAHFPDLWQNAAQTTAFCSWVDNYVNKPSAYAVINQGTGRSMIDRLKTCVPSNSQSSITGGTQMPWLESTANGMKAIAFAGSTIRRSSTFKRYSYSKKVFVIRAAAGVISYLNSGPVADQFILGSNCVKQIWSDFYIAYNADNNVDAPNRGNFNMVSTYRSYITEKVQNVLINLRNGVSQMIGFYSDAAGGDNIQKNVDLNYGKLGTGTTPVSADDLTNSILNWANQQALVRISLRL